MDKQLLRRDLIRDEGLKLRPYIDTRGWPTCWVGRNLITNPLTPEEVTHGAAVGYFTEAFAMWLLDRDIDTCIDSLNKFFPWWRGTPEEHQRVLVNMRFQLGLGEMKRFAPTLSLIQNGQIEAAIARIRKTPWFYRDSPERVARHFALLREGVSQ